MKYINISKIGYNHPSQANWSYGVWKVDCIDTDQPYNMSYTVKEAFGGDSRLREALTAQNIPVGESKGVYPSQKVTGIAKMHDMEGAKFISELVEWYNKK